jgi:hypothetical protein
MKIELLNVNDLLEWKEKQKLVYAFDSRRNKKLILNLNGGFEIEVNGEIIWQGIQAFSAVEKYNDL